MKRTILALSLITAALSVSAVNPSQVMEDSTSEALSMTTSHGYRINFSQQEAICGNSGADEATIETLDDGIEIRGTYQTPNPCHELTYDVEKSGDSYVLRIDERSTSDICVDCVGNVEYSAGFSAPGDYSIEVYHGEEKMAEKDVSSDGSLEVMDRLYQMMSKLLEL